MTVTFCGHSQVDQPDVVRRWLLMIVESMICKGADMFLLNGKGEFDQLAASVIGELKDKYPDIQTILVLSRQNMQADAELCDWTVCPKLKDTSERFAQVYKSQWIVDKSDVLIAYVNHCSDSAALTMEYALRKRIPVILYTGEADSAGVQFTST